MYAYEIGTTVDVANVLEDGLRRATESGRLGHLFPLESLVCLSGIHISDSGDGQLCSRGMQVLKRRGLVWYRRSYRQWENNLYVP